MTVDRLLMEAGRVILSRPGFPVSKTMPHSQKAFDSDWAYAGQLIAAGWEDDPSAPAGSSTRNLGATYSNAPWVIDFPQCAFKPTVILSTYFSPTYRLGPNEPRGDDVMSPLYWQYIQRGTASPYNTQANFTFEVTDSSIIIHRRNEGSWRRRWRFGMHYQVYGFSGADETPSSDPVDRLHLSADGLNISRPGFNAQDPSIAKLVDPAFPMLSQHVQKTATSVFVDGSSAGGWSRHRATITFDELPYRPLVHFGMAYNSGGVVNNTVRYPSYLFSHTAPSSLVPGGRFKIQKNRFWAESYINGYSTASNLFRLNATVYKNNSGLPV